MDLSLILTILLYRRLKNKHCSGRTEIKTYKMIDREVANAILCALDDNIGGLTECGLISYFEREGFDFTNWEIKQSLCYLEMVDRVGCEVEKKWINKTCSCREISIYYNRETANRIFQ